MANRYKPRQTVLVNGQVVVVDSVSGESVTVRFATGMTKVVQAKDIPSFK